MVYHLVSWDPPEPRRPHSNRRQKPILKLAFFLSTPNFTSSPLLTPINKVTTSNNPQTIISHHKASKQSCPAWMISMLSSPPAL